MVSFSDRRERFFIYFLLLAHHIWCDLELIGLRQWRVFFYCQYWYLSFSFQFLHQDKVASFFNVPDVSPCGLATIVLSATFKGVELELLYRGIEMCNSSEPLDPCAVCLYLQLSQVTQTFKSYLSLRDASSMLSDDHPYRIADFIKIKTNFPMLLVNIPALKYGLVKPFSTGLLQFVLFSTVLPKTF